MAGIVTDDRQRLEQEIARKEETIQKLRTVIRSNEERIKKLEDDEEAQKEKIKALEAENKELGDKIKTLENENKALKEEIDKLKNENESLVKKQEVTNKRIDELEKEKSVLIITQMVPAIQRNICKYVLGKHFKEDYHFYKVEDLEKQYIAKWLKNKAAEQDLARQRLRKLKGMKIWDESLVDSLKDLKKKRNDIAHPKLTSENIQQAMECLKEDLDEEMLDKIRKLKKSWETSESLFRKPEPESANENQVGGKSGKREQLQTALPCKRQDGQSMNEEELRKKEQELQEKEKEIEELKRKEKDAQDKLQKQAKENKILTAKNKELEEKVERLNAEMKMQKEELENQRKESENQKKESEKLKEELEKQRKESENQKKESEKLKEELEDFKGNEHNLQLAAMCDQLQRNFYKIVFHPHDFSKEKQSYQEKDIEYNINEGHYGLTTEEDKRQAIKRWSDLKNKLRWKSEDHVREIKQLKYDRNLAANPKINDINESLEDGAKALYNERKLDEPTFGFVQNLIEMWIKITEDLVQRMKISV